MNVLDQLQTMGLQDKHFTQKVEFLIDGFLPKNLIMLYWAEGGNGKSLLAQAITNHLLTTKKIKGVTQIDMDNPVSILKERKINEILVNKHPNLNYIQRSRLEMSEWDLLMLIEMGAVGTAYRDHLFIFDSLRNFVDVQNDAKTMRAMDAMMNIREAGATIIILSHANKDGKNYQGSNNIKNSIDCMYKLRKVRNDNISIEYILEVQKERAGIVNCAWHVDTTTMTLTPKEFKTSAMSDYDKSFTAKVTEALRANPDGLNKTQLLEEIGHTKDDKTARDALDRYDGDLYHSAKVSNVYTYTLKEPTTATTATSCSGCSDDEGLFKETKEVKEESNTERLKHLKKLQEKL